MKRLLLNSAATAVLALSLSAAHAQSPIDRQGTSAGETQQSAPGGAERGRSSTQKDAPSRGAPRAGDATRQRGTTGEARDSDREKSRGQSESKDKPKRAEEQKSRGQAEERSTPRDRRDIKSETRRRDSREEQRERPDRERGATGASGRQERSSRQSETEERRDRARRDRPADGARSDRDRERGGRAVRSEDNRQRGGVSLSNEQRERVTMRFSERIDRLNVRPVSRSTISVSVGATVPRSVRMYDVPDDVIALYPRFRGDKFVLVEDEIVIIEPGSRRIVATLPRSGGAVTTGTAVSGGRIRLSPDERRTIHTIVMREPSCRYEPRIDFRIGIPLPSAVQVCDFPEAIVTEVPEVRRYRFMVRGDEVVIVDPDERRVVDVID